MTDTEPLADPVEEGLRVVEAADERGLTVRTIGGTAIWQQSETAREQPFKRPYRDVDFVTVREDEDDAVDLMLELGYEPNKRLNTMHRYRLEFFDPVNDRKADYIVDRFQFSHEWSLRDRVEVDYPTVPVEDLLLSKLQIAEISDRDIRDILAMVVDHPVGDGEEVDVVDAGYVADLVRADWGLYKTLTMNLDRVESYLEANEPPLEESTVRSRLGTLRTAIEDVPKTLRWKLRSIIGERKQWYRRPEV